MKLKEECQNKEYQKLSDLQHARYKSERIREKLNSRNSIITEHLTQEQFNSKINEFDKEVEQAYSKNKVNKSLNLFYFKHRNSSDHSVRFRTSSRKGNRELSASRISQKSINTSRDKIKSRGEDSISILNDKQFIISEWQDIAKCNANIIEKKAFNLVLPGFNQQSKGSICFNPLQSLKASSSTK